MALEIVHEDDQVLVINKPAGLLVHPTDHSDEETLVDLLKKHCPEITEVGEDPTRPGIVHRLDRDVTGLMVVAKTQEMFEQLKEQFQNRTIEKEYLGLVYGQLSKDFDRVKMNIARSKATGQMVARPESQEGREAITEYDVIERFKTATYLRIKILTGRRHQIRLVFKALGHPVVGDNLYSRRMKNIKPIKMDRVFLHATKLSFDYLDGTRKTFESPLPDELQKIIDQLPKQ